MPSDPKKRPFDLVRSDTPADPWKIDSLIDKVTPDSLNPNRILANLRLPERLEEALREHFEPYGMSIEPGSVTDLYTDRERPVTRVHRQDLEILLLHIPQWIVGNATHVGSILEIQPALFQKTARIVSPDCDAPALALSDMLEDWSAHPKAERQIRARFVAWTYFRDLIEGKYTAAKVFKLDLQPVKPAAAADAVLPIPIRSRVFVSYAGADDEWLERLQGHLKPLLKRLKKEHPERVDDKLVFDATKIAPGERWKEEIDQALARARVGVLLVSKAFLESDFIENDELLPILKAAEEDGLKILWVLLDVCNWEKTEIAKFQSVVKPVEPLQAMDEPAYEAILKKLSNLIVDELRK